MGYYARHIPSHLQTQGQEVIKVEVPAYQTSVLDELGKPTKLDFNLSYGRCGYGTPPSPFDVRNCCDYYSTPPPVFAEMKKPKHYRFVSHDDESNDHLQSKKLEDELAQTRARVMELESSLSRQQHKDKLGKISSIYPHRIVTAASSPVAVGVSSQLAQVPKQADELSWLPFTASTSSIISPCKMMHMENVKDNGKKRRLKY